MEDFLRSGDFNALADYCEQEELKAPDCIPSPQVYGALLGTYLWQNELDHAKLLWQRIPKPVKESNKEIGELWEIGKRLWRREFAAVYELTANPAWPPHLAPIVSSLVGRVRERVIMLVGKAYSTIRVSDLCTLLGQSEQQVRQAVLEKGWEFDSQNNIYRPKPPQAPESGTLLEHDKRLQRLTDIVSFLEN